MTEKNSPTIKSYTIGFGLSLLLTFLAFGLTILHVNSGHYFIHHSLIIPVILVLAMLQLVVQLVFFLHVLHEDKPRWNLLFFIGTFSLVLLVVISSLWIMAHLNYNMTPQGSTDFIIQDEGIRTIREKNSEERINEGHN